MPLIPIAKQADIKSGELKEVVIADQRVILLEHKGKIKAYQGLCPHEGTPLAEGYLENGHVVCPMHHWKFACSDGQHTNSKACLKSFATTVADGKVFIDDSLLPGQYKKEDHRLLTIDDLPSPKGKFLLGHIKEFNVENKHQVLEQWAHDVGEIYKINFLGKQVIVSANPDFNKKVLKARPDKFRRLSRITEVAEEMGVLGVFNAEGDTWKKHRRLTSEALNVKNIRGFFPIIAKITDRMLVKMSMLASENKRIDIQKEMMRYTVDITTTIAFGYPMNTLDNDDDVIQDHLEKVFPMINRRISAPFRTWRYIKTKKDKELDIALAAIEKTVKSFIQEARTRLKQNADLRENPTNFLEALLVEQEKEGNFSDHEIYGNVFSILLAGEDTTSNSISWALFYLAQHPKVIQQVRSEAFEVYGASTFPPTYEVLSRLSYAESVANEALSTKPVAPNMFHQPNEDIEINGLLIKKDTPLIFQTKVAQTDERYFAEPESFIPERWMKGKCPFNGAHNPDVIGVFGGGTRYCPGKNLAIKEMVMAISAICKNFDVVLDVEPDEVREIFAFSMYPENLWIKLSRHIQSATPEALADV